MKRLLAVALLPLAICAQHVPHSYSLRLEPPAAWELGALSRQESAPLNRHGARQIGVRRAVPANWLGRLLVTTHPDGTRLCLAAFRSQGAAALRVHFRDFAAGAGEVWLYDLHHKSVAGMVGTGDFWSGEIPGDEIVIEYDAPATASPAIVPFDIDAISHHWISISKPTAIPVDAYDTAAPCELDVTCYADWAKYATGVVEYAFLGDNGGAYSCSGALLKPGGHTFAPYMLTANHCISSPAEAHSSWLIFGYQTNICKGTEGDINPIGSGSGTTYLAGAPIEEGDFTLVSLTDPPPEGVYLFGWSLTEPKIGEAVVGIHHPMSSWTRISFGTRSNDQGAIVDGHQAPATSYYQVSYNQGVIEPGSSGSPLLNAAAEVIGTATDAAVSPQATVCDMQPMHAGYGRFEVAYKTLATYLNANVDAAPDFTVSPASLSFTQSNGQLTGLAGPVQVTTTSTLPVPFSMQVADPWLQAGASSWSVIEAPALISADKPITVTASPINTMLISNGTYHSSIIITVGAKPPVTIPVTMVVANTQSRVIPAVNGNPFTNATQTLITRMQAGDSPLWRFNLSITETAGVATTITTLAISGQDISSQIPNLFGSSKVPASGTVNAVLTIGNIVYNDTNFIDINGADPVSGATWTQHLFVQFAGPPGSGSGMLASAIPSIVYPNPGAPDCPIRQHIVIQAGADSPLTLAGLKQYDGPDMSSLLSAFASTYIPAGGSAEADMCWPDAPITLLTEITGWSGQDMELSAAGNGDAKFFNEPGVAFAAPPPVVSRLAIGPAALSFGSAQPAPATVSVDPGSAGMAWNATVVYEQQPNSWLAVTPMAGSGAATVKVSVNPAGLMAGGVYRATLIVQSLNSSPQYQVIPITFEMPSAGISILNSASFTAGVAPGMVLSLFATGIDLAASPEGAAVLPLPLSMQGTTVTVNNIAAPLYYVSPAQLNVQIPYEIPPGPATLSVSNGSGSIVTQQIFVNPVAPGIFLGPDQRHIAPTQTAKAGGYVTLYLTGQGPVSPAVATGVAPPNPDQVPVSGLPHPYGRVEVFVNGVAAHISFAGIPYYLVGVMQVNFVVPPGTAAGDQPVVVKVAGVPAKTAYVIVAP